MRTLFLILISLLWVAHPVFAEDESSIDLVDLANNQPKRALFNYYCKDGKQIRAIEIGLIKSLAPAQSGIALDEAAASEEQQKEAMRASVANIFNQPISDDDVENAVEIFKKLKDRGEKTPDFAHIVVTLIRLREIKNNFVPIIPPKVSHCSQGYRNGQPVPSELDGGAIMDDIWKCLITDGTHVQEAPQPDGTYHFRVSLDFSLACKYARPIWDLESK